MLKAGGHAVDAAVAAAFAVGVVEPWMSGIGGVGAMLVYEAATGKITGIDFGARSPKSLDPKAYRADRPARRGQPVRLADGGRQRQHGRRQGGGGADESGRTGGRAPALSAASRGAIS